MMMKKIVIVVISMFWSMLCSAHPANDFMRLLNNYTTYSANFKQLTLGQHEDTQQGTGRVMIQRPGKFRWVSLTPTNEELIVNGDTVWRYDVAFKEVSKKITTELTDADNPVSLLTMPAHDLLMNYDISVVTLQHKNWYLLIPKDSSATFKKAYFDFEQGKLTQLIVVNTLDERSLYQFSNIRLNQIIPASVFIFVPPKGADVDDDA